MKETIAKSDWLKAQQCPAMAWHGLRTASQAPNEADRFRMQQGQEHIRTYQLFLVKEGKLSQSTYIQVASALRFLYTHTLNRQVSIDRIPFPRRERKLPIILSQAYSPLPVTSSVKRL